MFRSNKRQRVIAENSGEIVTKQAMKDECDINRILTQYKKTGIITHISNQPAQYLDLPSEIDLQSAMNTVLAAQEAFAGLPSVVRDAFRNDPERFLAALSDPKYHEQLVEWGILNKTDPKGLPAASAAPPASGPGSVPVPGTGPIPAPAAPPASATNA